MKSKELKDYLSVIKSFRPKRGTLPILKGFAKSGDTIITSDLDHFATLNVGTALEDGVYDEFALDLIIQNVETQIAKSNRWTLDDFPELEDTKWGEKRPLTNWDLDKIIEAVECVSKDDLRPALEVVALYDGYITGTDGYVMFTTTQSNGLNYKGEEHAYLDAKTVSALKKLRKYGIWTIRVNKDLDRVQLSNGTLTIDAKTTTQPYPDIAPLVDKHRDFADAITFGFETISALATKDRDTIEIDIESGEISLEKNPTGVVARVSKGFSTNLPELANTTRRVIMPKKGDPAKITLSVAFLKRLNRKQKSMTLLANIGTGDLLEVL